MKKKDKDIKIISYESMKKKKEETKRSMRGWEKGKPREENNQLPEREKGRKERLREL